jgi:hypothetical protein
MQVVADLEQAFTEIVQRSSASSQNSICEKNNN